MKNTFIICKPEYIKPKKSPNTTHKITQEQKLSQNNRIDTFVMVVFLAINQILGEAAEFLYQLEVSFNQKYFYHKTKIKPDLRIKYTG